jgi:hypothetical protein
VKIQPRSSTSTYDWKYGFEGRFAGSAQEVGERLEMLIEANNGQLTAAHVVDDARNPESILHPSFEWNDSVAAEMHRAETARKLMRSIVVVSVGDHVIDAEVRGFVAVKDEDNATYYTSTVYAIQQPDLREQILEKAWRDLESWRNKYEHLKEFSNVINAIKRIDIKELVKAVPA